MVQIWRSQTRRNQTGRDHASSAFGARYFVFVWSSGLIWHLTRWGVAFLGTYLTNEMTGSPRLVQLAGTFLYAPLLIGGVIGGVVSDRFDRLTTVRIQLSVLIPLSLLVGWLVTIDRAPVWSIYAYMFVVGIGWVTDMTSRRALIYDLVGEDRVDHAMAMESLSLSSGMVMGALFGGSAVEAVGVGPAYFLIGGLLLLALVILSPVKTPTVATGSNSDAAPETLETTPATTASTSASTSPVRDLVDGFKALRAQRGVLSVLGVTVIANFFLFAYFPIIPVVADSLNVTPIFVGLLSAATGIGMMTGSLVMARFQPTRRGLVYTVGLAVGMLFLIPFSRGTNYGFVLAALICSGIGSGLFGSTQTTLVMAAAPEALRGRALGLLSMAIGALPVGMYALGELAEWIGVPNALTVNAVLGLVTLGLWSLQRPEVRHMRAATSTTTATSTATAT